MARNGFYGTCDLGIYDLMMNSEMFMQWVQLPVAAIAGDDELLVGPASEATENCLGCGRSMPVDSVYAFCARCE